MQNNFFYVSTIIAISLAWPNAHAMENGKEIPSLPPFSEFIKPLEEKEKNAQIQSIINNASALLRMRLQNIAVHTDKDRTLEDDTMHDETETQTEKEQKRQRYSKKDEGKAAACRNRFNNQFECPTCTFTTTVRTNFFKHLYTHLNEEFKCSEEHCTKKYRNPYSLREHQNRVHPQSTMKISLTFE